MIPPRPTPPDLEAHRVAVRGHCYRMLGGFDEAEDAAQETLIRAWRALDGFEGRSSLRSWLLSIATRVCLDALRSRARRARPMDLGPAGTLAGGLGEPLAPEAWVEPVPDAWVLPPDAADRLEAREDVRLALVAALQHLPPRQRAALLLREVLDAPAAAIAETLGTTVPAVNSALQRARATLAARAVDVDAAPADPALLARYVDAFERYDLDALAAILHEDATISMPPFPLWLRGHEAIRAFMLGPGGACRGSRLVPTRANGAEAYGQYKPDGAGRWTPWSLILLDVRGDRLAGMCHFLDTAAFFPRFGLPPVLEG